MSKGLGLARGDIVGYINSDDFYPTLTELERVAEAFDNRSVDAVYGDLCCGKQHDPAVIVRYWRPSPFTPGMFSRVVPAASNAFCQALGVRAARRV